MVAVREMPDSEKYAAVQDDLQFEESFTLPFIRRNLGEDAVAEFQNLLRERYKPVANDMSSKDTYEAAPTG
ncbi:MAG: hypothetical protein JXA87_10315 [Thermoleophilia bacterium]|nr:hypothetical protein [Thermoleophilia bacterium]